MDSVIPDLETILEHNLPLGVFDGVLDGSSCNQISAYIGSTAALATLNKGEGVFRGSFWGPKLTKSLQHCPKLP